MPNRSKCPSCGSNVSPYAAGCAVCGADLDTKRWDTGPGALQRAGSWLQAVSFGAIPNWALWVIVVIVIAVTYRLI